MVETRLSHDIDLDGLTPDEAFTVLGNETRLNIIRALWTAGAHYEFADLDDSVRTIPFSELQRAAGIEDNGRFNYHLSKLVPHFVRRTDDGYHLSSAGEKIIRAVVSISGDPTPLISNDVETRCPLCDGSLAAIYEDQWLRFSCTECEGAFGETAPKGAIFNSMFPAAGLADRTPDEAYLTGTYRCLMDLTYLMQGVCRECASPVTASTSICDNHDVGGTPSCSTCSTPYHVWADIRCETCRFAKRLPVELCVMGLTPVISFLYERGIDLYSREIEEFDEMLMSRVRTSVTSDPTRIHVAIGDETSALTVTFDDELNLADVER